MDIMEENLVPSGLTYKQKDKDRRPNLATRVSSIYKVPSTYTVGHGVCFETSMVWHSRLIVCVHFMSCKNLKRHSR